MVKNELNYDKITDQLVVRIIGKKFTNDNSAITIYESQGLYQQYLDNCVLTTQGNADKQLEPQEELLNKLIELFQQNISDCLNDNITPTTWHTEISSRILLALQNFSQSKEMCSLLEQTLIQAIESALVNSTKL